MPLLIKDQRTLGWYEARTGRITASYAAAILGLDPYTGGNAAFNKIMGNTGHSTNKHMAWGNQFEADAVSDYERRTGNIVYPTGFWVHPEHDWLGASPDGLIGSDGGLEVKCPSEVPSSVPVQHRIQCIVQMLVTGRQWVDYFAWAMSSTYLERVYRPKTGDGMIRKLKAWYEAYIVTNTPPKIKRRKKKETVS